MSGWRPGMSAVDAEVKFRCYATVGDAESARGSDVSDHLFSPSNRSVIEFDSELG